MRSRLALLMTVVVLLVAVIVLPACSSGSNGGGGSGGGIADAKTLILNHCTVCHDVSRIRRARHDGAGWQATVQRMRGKGAKVDDNEASTIVEFLAGGGGSSL